MKPKTLICVICEFIRTKLQLIVVKQQETKIIPSFVTLTHIKIRRMVHACVLCKLYGALDGAIVPLLAKCKF